MLAQKFDENCISNHEIFSIREADISHLSRLTYIGQLIDIVEWNELEWVNNNKINTSELKILSSIILRQIEETLNKNPYDLKDSTIEKVAIKIWDKLIWNENLVDFAIWNYIKRVAYQVSNIHLRHERYKKHIENRKLKIENKTDDLTKLLTKASINSYIEKIISDKINWIDLENYWIILVDIDFFKVLNDNFWHLAWDIVLEEISKIFRDFFRWSDKIARWWWEEFLILMKWWNQEEYWKKMEKVRKYIELNLLNIVNERIEREWKFWKIQLNNITISSWITSLVNDDCVTSVTKRADEALYSSKRNGRNTIRFMQKYNEEWLPDETDIKIIKYEDMDNSI